MNIALKDWPVYLLILLPFAIISGPFFSDLFIIIVDIWFLIKIFKNNDLKKKYLNNNFFLFFILFNFYIVTVSLFSENYLYSLKSSFFYFRFYIFAFAICMILNTYYISLKYFFYSISLSIVLIILFAFYDLVIVKDFFNNVQAHSGELMRVSGLFGDELIMGSVLKTFFTIFIVFFNYLNFFKKNYVNLWSITFIFWIVFFTILISGERVSIFIFSIFSILTGFILSKKIDLLKISILTIIPVILLFFTFDNLRDRVIKQTLTQITNNQEFYDNQGNIIERDKEKFVYLSIHHDAHARTAIDIFLDKPLIGHGPKSFRNICKEFEYNEFSCTTHPHNFYLQILSETGLIGVFFVVVVIFNLFKFLRADVLKKDKLSFQILSIYLLIHLIPFLPSGNIFNNFYNINLFMVIGFYLYFMDYNKKIIK